MSSLPSPASRRRISAPRAPEVPAAHRFPILATIAPVIASLVLWAVMRSPYALAFAALGPVVALASGADARLQRRRARRREAERFDRDCAATSEALAAAHDRERHELERGAPAVSRLLDELAHHRGRWRGGLAEELPIRVGTGAVPSTVEYSTAAESGHRSGEPVAFRLRELRESAAVVPGAPVTVDARASIGFTGPRRLALAAARGAVLRLAAALPPTGYAIGGPAEGEAWDWLDALPHARTPSTSTDAVTFAAVGAPGAPPLATQPSRAVIATAATSARLPREVGIVIELDETGGARILAGAPSACVDSVEAEFVAQEDALRGALLLAELARAEGAEPAAARLPDLIELAELLGTATPPTGLRCVVGVGERGAVELDLVADGPHAIVGGTTGSGKSELLLSWVLAMAAPRSPAEVTFLFVDFKGGASFDPLLGLPHCVGVITDLDADESLRALSSLGAELRYRERILAEHRLRSVNEAHPMPFPRLVVVVDEYAALIETHSALHSVFIDIAARGRSLGVHLVLCTQRPAGVVRESILANCGLRISLRVNSGADSTAVIGTADAAGLPARPRGRAFASIAGSPPECLQIARSSAPDVGAVVERWSASPAPRRPWCAPLPAVLPVATVSGERPADDIPFCLVDRPELQRQQLGRYAPAQQGSLLVVGGPGSGKSGLLAALLAAPSLVTRRLVPSGLPAVWDALVDVLDPAASPAEPSERSSCLLLIDDVDALVSSCPEDYEAALLDLLSRALREGPSRGIHFALTAQRIPGPLQSVAALCGSRVVLAMPSRQEHVLAGGDGAEFSPGLRQGAAHWAGHRIQVLLAEAPLVGVEDAVAIPQRTRRIDLASGSPLAVVSTRPERFASTLRELLPGRPVTVLGARPPIADERAILVGDPETWQAQWGVLGTLRGTAELLFDGCSLLDFRTLTRSRELPPPSPRGERPLWLLGADGRLSRARLASRTGRPPPGIRHPSSRAER